MAGESASTAVTVVDDDPATGSDPAEREPFTARADLRLVDPQPLDVTASLDRASLLPGEQARLTLAAAADAAGAHHQLVVGAKIAGASAGDVFSPHGVTVVPRFVPGTQRVTAVAAGGRRNIALLDGGEVRFWGLNENELRMPAVRYWTTPRALPGVGAGATAVAASEMGFMVLRGDGAITTWSRYRHTAMGGPQGWDLAEVRLPGGASAAAVAAGRDFMIALDVDGQVWAWGSNAYGQLGIDRGTQRSDGSVRVGVPGGAVALAAAKEHALALRADGSVWAWGALDPSLDRRPDGGRFHAPGPIEFGFLRANSTAVGGAACSTRAGMDNWRVTVHR